MLVDSMVLVFEISFIAILAPFLYEYLHLLGQTLNKTQNKALEELDPNAPWHKKLLVKYRLFVGIGIASGLCHIVWWTCAIKYNWFALFPDRYYMTLTMILGGCVAGNYAIRTLTATSVSYVAETVGIEAANPVGTVYVCCKASLAYWFLGVF